MPTVEDYERWLVRRGRERSKEVYSQTVRRYLEDPEEYEKSLLGSEHSPNYRRFLAAALKSWATFSKNGELLAWLSDLQLPAAIPASVREPFDRKVWVTIRKEVAGAAYLKPSVRCACGIVAVRGIRCGDVARATKSEVQKALKTGILALEGKRERRHQYNAAPLMPYLEELDELFTSHPRKADRIRDLLCKSGKQSSATTAIRRGLDAVSERLGMDPEEVYPHRFRHTYATYYLQEMQGDAEAIFKLQQQMAWARLETAANYLRRSRREELDDVESRLLGQDE